MTKQQTPDPIAEAEALLAERTERLAFVRAEIDRLSDAEAEAARAVAVAIAEGVQPNGLRDERLSLRAELDDLTSSLPILEGFVRDAEDELHGAEVGSRWTAYEAARAVEYEAARAVEDAARALDAQLSELHRASAEAYSLGRFEPRPGVPEVESATTFRRRAQARRLFLGALLGRHVPDWRELNAIAQRVADEGGFADWLRATLPPTEPNGPVPVPLVEAKD